MNNELNKPKILVVEDNPLNMDLFLEILAMAGYSSVHTSNGEEAIDIAKKEKPDLILLDIQLPGMDGLSVADILRSSDDTKHIKIIAVTAHSMRGDKEMFLSKGFDGYIPKPIRVKEFLKTIEEFLSGQDL